MKKKQIEEVKITESRVKKTALISIGTLSVSLGIIGVFIPILPTTPFLLLAAACYIRSSRRLYTWLITNKYFGKFIINYREQKGIPLSIKISVLTLLWLTISLSAIYATENVWIRLFCW
jgi:uncharacterized membrane protein YbaN (DUF454 family)